MKQIFVLTSVDELPTKTADNTILVPIDDTAHVSADDADDDVPVDDTDGCWLMFVKRLPLEKIIKKITNNTDFLSFSMCDG